MSRKIKMWDAHTSWEDAEQRWDTGARNASRRHPLKSLSNRPSMLGITKKTAKNLKWKSLKWMITQDKKGGIRRGFFKHPLKYSWAYLKSIVSKKPYIRDNEFFLYGIQSVEEFEELLKDPKSIFVLGFSYCHKPFECPSKRFTPECVHDPDHPVCRQCFIGKATNALPEKNSIFLAIPTVHYIAEKILEIMDENPGKKILFIITACEMTLEMFSDWGNMAGVQGIGVRLGGRICNTMKAFELSEKGTKPGLTVVSGAAQQGILDFIRHRRE